MKRTVVFPMFGSRESDFAVLPGFGGPRRKRGVMPTMGASVINAILLEDGTPLLAENGNYLQTET